MSRLILLMLLGVVVAFYFPDSRQAIIEKASPALVPVFEWSAKGEMDEIARSIGRMDRIQRRVPSRREWVPYLEQNFSGEAGIDPWGSLYQFQAWRDSFAIISYGADRERSTGDDILRVFRRDG